MSSYVQEMTRRYTSAVQSEARAEPSSHQIVIDLVVSTINELAVPTRRSMALLTAILSSIVDHQRFCLFPMQSISKTTWSLLPCYFVFLRGIFALFTRLCQRRSRSKSHPPNQQSNNKSEMENVHYISDWDPVWSKNEVDQLLHSVCLVLRNVDLLTPFVQVAVEGINLYDMARYGEKIQ